MALAPFDVVQEHVDPRQLSVNITSSSGRVFRWGPDESDPTNVPGGLTITTQMPGGFGTMDCNLNRRPDLSYADLDRFAPCTVTGPGNLVAFDGYLSSRPLQRTTSYLFTPEAIGWSGHLKDDASFSMVYIDRQLSKWTSPTTGRTLSLLNNNINPNAISMSVLASPPGIPAIQFETPGPINAGTQHWRVEAWYDAGASNVIANFRATSFAGISMATNDGNSSFQLGMATDSTSGGTEFSYANATSGQPMNAGFGTPARYPYFYWQYNATGGTTGQEYGFLYENVAVVGNHGLTIRAGPSGTLPGADDGFWGSDLVADIVKRAAPKLNYTTGPGGSIVQNTFVVPNLAFNTPVDADTAITNVNQYFLNDYGVYENKTFFWRPSGTGRTWHVRVGDGVQLTDQGPQIETAFNGVVVQYTDPAGRTRYVGPPPNTWDKDPVTSATNSTLLQDLSASNPCNLYGRKRWALTQMGTTTWQGAVNVGAIFLQTSLSRPSTGSATVTGFAKDSTGREWPVWMMRAGDTLIFDDTADQTPHYVLSTSYNHDTLQNTLTLDAPPNALDWLLKRLGLVISALG